MFSRDTTAGTDIMTTAKGNIQKMADLFLQIKQKIKNFDVARSVSTYTCIERICTNRIDRRHTMEHRKYKLSIRSRSFVNWNYIEKKHDNETNSKSKLKRIFASSSFLFICISSVLFQTFASFWGSRKFRSRTRQCSIRNLSMLLASIARIKYSLTSSSGFFSSLLSLNPNLEKIFIQILMVNRCLD